MKKKLKKFFCLCVLIVPLVSIILFNLVAVLYPTPTIDKPYQIEVIDDHDETIYSRHFNGFGSYVPLSDISLPMQKCLINAEDQKFYKHWGFDYTRIISSLFQNITSKKLQSGGSTITQQYARTIYLSNDKTLKRKIKEAIITRKMEMSLSKEEILEGYLNCAYFGHNIYGIDQASYFFFNELPSNLTWSQSALLAGILSAPNDYSPLNNLDLANKKKEQVLTRLLNTKQIDQRIYEDGMKEQLFFNFQKKTNENKHIMYFHDAMVNELKKSDYFTSSYLRQGLRINSTLDKDVMNIISNTVQDLNLKSEDQEVAIVVMKPNTGDVLGLLGGIDYENSSYNRAISAKRQTGSAIKPLLYYLALENGLTPLTKMKSEPTTFYIEGIGEYSPKNANEIYANRDINMVEAIAYSDNIYATKTTLLLGSNTLKDALSQFGIEDIIANPTIGLGTNLLTPLELASIYNTFASEGKFYKPRFIKAIKTPYEKTKTFSNPLVFELNKQSTLTLNYLLRAPFDKSLTTYQAPSLAKYQTNKRFAGKTGSTDFDSWVCGFNPNYTITVFVGQDKNEPLKNGSLAKQIFTTIANKLTESDSDIFYSPMQNMKPFTLTNPTNKSQSFIYYT